METNSLILKKLKNFTVLGDSFGSYSAKQLPPRDFHHFTQNILESKVCKNKTRP